MCTGKIHDGFSNGETLETRDLCLSCVWLCGGMPAQQRAGIQAHLEVLDESAGVFPEGAMVGDHAATLEQQQIIKRLQQASLSSTPQPSQDASRTNALGTSCMVTP